MEQDRSPMPRYPFFAHAELAVENSDVHLTARLYGLSREGTKSGYDFPNFSATYFSIRF